MTRVRAAEALALGLVHQVSTADELDSTIDACLQELVAGGPQAQREIKSFFSQLEVGPVTAEVRELSAQTISRVRGTDEAREGFAAFLGKREAWKDMTCASAASDKYFFSPWLIFT